MKAQLVRVAAATAALAGLVSVSAADTSASTPTTTRSVASSRLVVPSQWTRQTLDLAGTWRLTSSFTQLMGQPVRPGSVTGNDVFVVLNRRTDLVAPPGNEPVYMGSIWSASTHRLIAGELFVSPYVSPRGIVLTAWQVGNPEGFSDAYEAVYTLQATNTTTAPLHFTGSWIDQPHNAGTSTFVPAPGTILLPSS